MSSQHLPLISIITPTLNRADKLEHAILNVVEQKYPFFQHIIIDGGSTDHTLKIVKKYKHLTYFSKKNLGQIDALNKGLSLAKGEIVTSLNDDDFFSKDTLLIVGKFFKQHHSCKVLFGNCNYYNEESGEHTIIKPSTSHSQLIQYWKYSFPINPSSYFYKKEIHEKIGLFSKKYGQVFDYEFILRMSKRYPIFYIDKTLGNFLFYVGTQTHDNWDKLPTYLLRVSKNYWGSKLSINFYYYHVSLFFWKIFR